MGILKINFFVLLLSCSIIAQNSDYDKAVKLFDQNEYKKSRIEFIKILNREPNNKKVKEYLGDVAGYLQEWDTALAYYKELLETDNSNANYHFKYGGKLAFKAKNSSKLKALGMIGDFKKHLHKAADLDSTHIEVRWALVEIYISLPTILGGSEEKAKQYANELSKLSLVDGYLALGYVAEYNDRPKDAEMNYRKAIEVGGSMHTFDKLSKLYESTNQPNKAIENYENAHVKHDRNQLNYQIGKVCAQYNLELDKGLNCLQIYIDNYSALDGVPVSWAYFRMAQIYRHKMDKRNKALELDPQLKDAISEKELILKMPSKKS